MEEKHGKSVELRKCSNGKQFLDEMNQYGKSIVAAILDVEGFGTSDDVSLQGSTNQDAFYNAKDGCAKKNIPYVIYSGNVCGGTADNPSFKSSTKGVKVVPKGFDDGDDTLDEKNLYEYLIPYIKNFIWTGFEYVYTLQAKNYINISPDDKEILERIVKSYKGNEIQYDLAFKGTMRKIMESILDTLFANRTSWSWEPLFEHYHDFYHNPVGIGVRNHNNDIDYIVEGCYNDKNRKTLWGNFLFPLNVCPQEIKNALSFVWSALNNGLHNRLHVEEEEREAYDQEIIVHFRDYFNDDKSVEKTYARALYDSFFLVLRWYSIFMENECYLELPQQQNDNHSNAQR